MGRVPAPQRHVRRDGHLILTTTTPAPQGSTTSVEQVATVCSYCGVGCGIVLDVACDADGPPRRARCPRGQVAPGERRPAVHQGRDERRHARRAGAGLTHALVRERSAVPSPCERTVDETIALAARRLREIVDEHGPDAVALYVSGQMSLEAQYLANKLAKGFVAHAARSSRTRGCAWPARARGYKLSLGADGPPGSYDDFDHADVFLVIGSNMADCHPILFLRMMDRVKAGAKLIVVDPRRTATADKADLFLQISARHRPRAAQRAAAPARRRRAGSTRSSSPSTPRAGRRCRGLLADYPPDVVAAITGIAEADLRTAAAMIGGRGQLDELLDDGAQPVARTAPGTRTPWSTCTWRRARSAAPAAGPFSLTGQPNAMGGREMGYMGPGLPGQRSVLVDDDRAFVEDLWDLAAGHAARRRRRHAAPSTCSSAWPTARSRPAGSSARTRSPRSATARTVIEGLEAAELVITQDVFADTETNAYADVVLPGALWAEADGVMVNSERNLTLARAAVDPPGEALPGLAAHRARSRRAMGYATGSTTPRAEEVFDELTRASRTRRTGYDLRGVTYERLRETSRAVAGRRRTGRDRNPIRYLNDGVSQQLLERPDGTRPRLAFADAVAAGPCSTPARTCPPPSCPTTTSRSCSTPAACSTSGTR